MSRSSSLLPLARPAITTPLMGAPPLSLTSLPSPSPPLALPATNRPSGSALVSPAARSGSGFHNVTPNPFAPGTAWKNSYGTVDKEAAQLGAAAGFDMLGAHDGGLLLSSSDGPSGGGPTGWDDEFDGAPSAAAGSMLDQQDQPQELPVPLESADDDLPPQAKFRLDEQAAYIAELEEVNLNLRERLFLLEQQLNEQQQQGKTSPASSGDQESRGDDVADEATSSGS